MQISNGKIIRRVKCLQLGGDVTAGDHVGALIICGRWHWIKDGIILLGRDHLFECIFWRWWHGRCTATATHKCPLSCNNFKIFK
jgi:hypothetical protein